MNTYFVYALIDPRDGSIFYIGMGHGDRPYKHLKEAQTNNTKNPYKVRKINNILKAGFECYDVQYLHQNLTQEEAYQLEIKEIASHDNLTNISLGGSGGDNISQNPNREAIIANMKEAMKKRFESEEARRKNAHYGSKNGMFGRHHKKESIEQMLRNHKSGSYENQYGEERAKEIKTLLTAKLNAQYANGRKPAGCFTRYEETEADIELVKKFHDSGLKLCTYSRQIGLSVKLIKRIAKDHNIEL